MTQALKTARLFWSVYRLYRACHSPAYAARIAYGMAVRKLPF